MCTKTYLSGLLSVCDETGSSYQCNVIATNSTSWNLCRTFILWNVTHSKISPKDIHCILTGNP